MNRHHLIPLMLCLFCCALGAGIFAQDPNSVEERVKKARAMLFDKKYAEALNRFELILKDDPGHLEAQLGKISALKGLKKPEEINKFAKKKAKANTPETHTFNAQLKMVRRDFKGANADLEQALAKKNDFYMALYLKGVIRKLQKNPKEAVQMLSQAIKANADFPESYYELGDLYYSGGNTSKAVHYWKEYLKRVPKTGKRYQYVNAKLQKLGGQ